MAGPPLRTESDGLFAGCTVWSLLISLIAETVRHWSCRHGTLNQTKPLTTIRLAQKMSHASNESLAKLYALIVVWVIFKVHYFKDSFNYMFH